MKLIIQIPCFNEEKTLPETFNDLPKSIEGVDEIEYLIINDGSTDNTVEIAKQIGVHHVVNFKQNSGLAAVFMAGLDACLRLGADIIVNTDADNQYCGEDIERLVKPILDGKFDIVVGSRPIDDIEHFSKKKKVFQHLGSWVVRKASNTDIPDSPSGFRAFSREAAMKLNVINQYTYTLETIIQAGQTRIAITSVPIRTNPETRKSRLFKSMFGYMKRSSSTIIRSFLMYKPLKFFCFIGTILFVAGFIIAARFSILFFMGFGKGHIQSLILSIALMLLGFEAILNGFQADLTAANRKLLEDIQYRVRKLDYDSDNINKNIKREENIK
jgi:glycosyltransferase involved in cell wall biosynthesis